jgi:hypothetical protein
MRRRNHPPKLVLSTSTASEVCRCGGGEWTFSTNGDGASLQGCTRCGTWVPIGRYFQDPSVGVRIIHYSWWSALVEKKI